MDNYGVCEIGTSGSLPRMSGDKMNKEQTIIFIEKGYEPMSIRKAFSEWAKENWGEIATQCYISVKAENIMRLLGYELTNKDNETNNQKLRAAHSIAYETGNRIREEKEKAEGWVFAIPSNFSDGDMVEMQSDGILGSSIIQGRIIKRDDRMWVLPKRNKTRGYALGAWQKIRKIGGNK